MPRSSDLAWHRIRLCWKVGIIWKLRAGRLGRFRFSDAEEVWMRPEAWPTWDVVGVEGTRGCRGRGMDRGDGVVLGSKREAPQLGANGVSPSFKQDVLVVFREDGHGVAVK